MKLFSLLALPILASACSAAQAAAPAEGETWIRYVRSEGVLDWKIAAKDALYVQGTDGKWYLVRTMGPCPRLRTAMRIGFVASPGDRLDRYSALLADGQRCQVDSVRLSPAPPPKGNGY